MMESFNMAILKEKRPWKEEVKKSKTQTHTGKLSSRTSLKTLGRLLGIGSEIGEAAHAPVAYKIKLKWWFLVLNFTERIQLSARNTQLKSICWQQAHSSSHCLLQNFKGFFQNLHFLPWKCYSSSTSTSLADNTAHYMQAAGPDLTDVFILLCVGPEWGITWDSSFKLGESS